MTGHIPKTTGADLHTDVCQQIQICVIQVCSRRKNSAIGVHGDDNRNCDLFGYYTMPLHRWQPRLRWVKLDFYAGDEGKRCLHNAGDQLSKYTASQPSRPQSQFCWLHRL